MDNKNYIDLLRNGVSPDDRRKGASMLVERGEINDETLEALAHGILDKDRGVKDICSRALVTFKDNYKEKIATLVAPNIKENDIENRNLASDILIKLGDWSITPLIQYTLDDYYLNRQFACDIMGSIGSALANDVVLMMTDDENDNVRNSVYEALGKMKLSDNLSLLISKYKTEIYDLKPTLIEAIGKTGGKLAQDFLLSTLKSEEDKFLQTTCIDALALGGEDLSICENLLDQLPHTSLELQTVLLKTIYAIAFRQEREIRLPDDLRYVAQNALFDDDDDIRGAGLVALGDIYIESDVDSLVHEVMQNNSDIQQMILYNLLCNSSAQVIENFFNVYSSNIEADHSEIDFLSYFSVFWNKIEDKRVEFIIELLVRLVFTTRFGVAGEIIEILEKLNRDKLIYTIRNEMYNLDKTYLPEALDIIEKIKGNELFDILFEMKTLNPELSDRIDEIIN